MTTLTEQAQKSKILAQTKLLFGELTDDLGLLWTGKLDGIGLRQSIRSLNNTEQQKTITDLYKKIKTVLIQTTTVIDDRPYVNGLFEFDSVNQHFEEVHAFFSDADEIEKHQTLRSHLESKIKSKSKRSANEQMLLAAAMQDYGELVELYLIIKKHVDSIYLNLIKTPNNTEYQKETQLKYTITFSSDYCTVYYSDTLLTLSSQQANIMKILDERRKKDPAQFSAKGKLLEDAGYPKSSKWKEVFRSRSPQLKEIFEEEENGRRVRLKV